MVFKGVGVAAEVFTGKSDLWMQFGYIAQKLMYYSGLFRLKLAVMSNDRNFQNRIKAADQ